MALVSRLMRSASSSMSSAPWYMSSQTNSSVYVAVLVLQPRRHINTFPNSFVFRGTLPLGYFLLNACSDMTCAVPLMEARGLWSQEGEMYNSFYGQSR